ncbi:DEAD/DEAH box helicase [Pseudalkalibacillus berkeleyi]|uniref:DEAD/DEAH box helicase n=1 Tax=Pseudalkalibacillus berkeleyi TaxID=1069813 RepID=A0ABS9H3V8_9BACL|nr:DEAD/DEAH box helicase [Pseudalkalibacillus berkeleyi]MCF6138645.1 DEAD/DEAH box helicase [Pseudalkalibacillus berkeleyi]
MTTFRELGITSTYSEKLADQGIKNPTKIQAQAIPLLMEGRDIIGRAKTGSGKTIAFLLPMLERLNTDAGSVQSLIITPTRELALQITMELKKLVEGKGINVLAVYGGQDINLQLKELDRVVDIVVGTPGRILDHMRRETIDLSQVSMLVLDEADQMLQIGFLDEAEAIIEATPKSRQTALFSATMPDEILSLTNRYLKDAHQIMVQAEDIVVREIEEYVIETTDRKKQNTLLKTVKDEEPFLGIIFCRTKRRVSKLNLAMQEKGFLTDELHGGLSQAKREDVMARFRDGHIHLLVATDVAARGLDVEGVTHIFNYDVPLDPDSYTHRIGRTGRAGESGVALTFIAPKDYATFDMIERNLNRDIPRKTIRI